MSFFFPTQKKGKQKKNKTNQKLSVKWPVKELKVLDQYRAEVVLSPRDLLVVELETRRLDKLDASNGHVVEDL